MQILPFFGNDPQPPLLVSRFPVLKKKAWQQIPPIINENEINIDHLCFVYRKVQVPKISKKLAIRLIRLRLD